MTVQDVMCAGKVLSDIDPEVMLSVHETDETVEHAQPAADDFVRVNLRIASEHLEASINPAYTCMYKLGRRKWRKEFERELRSSEYLRLQDSNTVGIDNCPRWCRHWLGVCERVERTIWVWKWRGAWSMRY